MAYARQTWADYPSGGTPVSAERLNHIEAGITDLEAVTLPASYVARGALMLDPVVEHGAVGDFSTDDTVALQSTLDDLSAAGGGLMFIRPNRNFTNTGLTIPSYCGIVGTGVRSMMSLKAGSTNHMLSLATPTTVYTTIAGVYLGGNSANQTVPTDIIHLDQTGASASIVPNHTIRNVWTHASKGNGVYLGLYTRNTVVEDLRIDASDQAGLALAGADSKLLNVDVSQSGTEGVSITGSAYLLSNIKSWYNGRLDGAGSGFLIAGSTIQIVGGHSQDNPGSGFKMFRSGTVLHGIGLHGCVSENDASVGFSLFNVTKANISGQVKTYAGGSGNIPVNGVSMDATTVGCEVTLTVEGQSGFAADGLGLGNNSLRINGRQGRYLVTAYAASITPNPFDAETVAVTLAGNITVANPQKKQAGMRLQFVFTQDATGGRTVTFGTDFSASWVPNTAANKINTIDFVSNGTKWIQTSTATI
jgi:hypothetical protein